MAKDPAVLWYFNDWHGGTITFSRHLKGAYMDLLYAQFNNGHLSLEEIKTVLGSDFGSSWPAIQKKFKTDDDGFYYNEKLEEGMKKRREYSESRRQNLKGKSDMDQHMKQHMAAHMENENENINNIKEGEILLMKDYDILTCKLEKGSIGYMVMEGALRLYKGFCQEIPNNRDLPFMTFKDWIPPVRELIEKKRYTFDQIKDVFLFARQHDFWKARILNSSDLNKHFEKIKQELQNP
jgi:hypothetical protein